MHANTNTFSGKWLIIYMTDDKMQNEFINITSPEMKTPTQSILLHSNLLYAQPEIRHESIEAICRSATRL